MIVFSILAGRNYNIGWLEWLIAVPTETFLFSMNCVEYANSRHTARVSDNSHHIGI